MPQPAESKLNPAECELLIDAARNGSTEAIGALLGSCRDYLLFVANRELEPELKTKIAPSDIVQETCAQAHLNIEKFAIGTSEAELLAWLRRILINNVITARRKYLGTQSRNASLELSLNDSQATGPGAGDLAGAGLSPSKHALLNEQLNTVEDVLNRLSSDHQHVLRLRYWENLPLAEIASRMNRSPDAVQKLWFRAVERFRAEFAASGGT